MITERCRKFQRPLSPQENESLLLETFVDDKHQVIYCPVRKCGSMSWRAVLLVLSGKFNNLTAAIQSVFSGGTRHLARLSNFDKEGIDWRLKTYTKFMAYRDPLVRFASAYLMFRTADTPLKKRVCEHVTKWSNHLKLTNHSSRRACQEGQNISIEEFAEFVVRPDLVSRYTGITMHWMPMELICHPCQVEYDYYIDMDSPEIAEDTDYLLERLHAPEWLHVPRENPGPDDEKERLVLKMSNSLLNQLSIIYRNDSEIFGFKH